MHLQPEAAARGGRLIVLLGNHEAEFLANPADAKSEETRRDADRRSPRACRPDRPRQAASARSSTPCRSPRVSATGSSATPVGCPTSPGPPSPRKRRRPSTRAITAFPFLLGDDSILEKKTSESGKKWWHSKKEIAELERRLDADGLAGVVFGSPPDRARHLQQRRHVLLTVGCSRSTAAWLPSTPMAAAETTDSPIPATCSFSRTPPNCKTQKRRQASTSTPFPSIRKDTVHGSSDRARTVVSPGARPG